MLRARPRRVARFKRRVVIGVAAVACIAGLRRHLVALNAPSLSHGQSGDQELFNTDRKPMADGLAGAARQLRPDRRSQRRQARAAAAGRSRAAGDCTRAESRNLAAAAQNWTAAEPGGRRSARRADASCAARPRRRARPACSSSIARGRRQAPVRPASMPAAARPERSPAPASDTAAARRQRVSTSIPTAIQNNQQRKLDFLERKQDRPRIYNPHGLAGPGLALRGDGRHVDRGEPRSPGSTPICPASSSPKSPRTSTTPSPAARC